MYFWIYTLTELKCKLEQAPLRVENKRGGGYIFYEKRRGFGEGYD